MTYDTINDARTVAGNAEGTLLANRYRIVRQLGQGGMGSVWLVEDTQLDDKPFAVKMLPSILVSNKRAYRQLKDEALVAMRLVHPNIVQIRAFEENDGNPFLVMDYVDGQTLDDYLAEHTGTTGVPPVGHGSTGTTGVPPVAAALPGRAGAPRPPQGGLSEAEVLRILRPIAGALDYAHAKGVVHRDVKPGNVMIAKDGTPYILDFGIAREIQETMTRVTGKLSSGTLLYMSPEQLMGDQPKPAQDIYSFAAMAYECLKGEPPFSHGQIEFQIMNKQPAPLVGRGVLDAPLAASVMAGLAKKPEDRPATCAAVLEGKDFGRAERVDFVRRGTSDTSQPGRARSPSAPPEPQPGRTVAPRPPQNGAWKVWPLVVVICLAVTCGITWLVLQDDAPRKVSRYERPSKIEESRPPQGVGEMTDTNEVPSKSTLNGSTEAEVTEIAVAASGLKECLARIDGADGFKEKKEEISSLLTRATSYGKARRYKESAQAFSNYVAKCQELVRLDVERKSALKDKAKAREAVQMAEAAGAKTYAVAYWNTAVGVWRQATDQFGRMEFSQAGRTFSSAAEHFTKCVDVVKKAKANEAAAAAETARRRTDPLPAPKPVLAKSAFVFPVNPVHKQTHTITLPGGATMEMIYVAPGTFTMGSLSTEEGRPDNESPHRVTLTKGFWLGKYEVTQEQWQSVMGTNPSHFKGKKHPIESVSWEDCRLFIQRVNATLNCGARLPTEAEWEYACRAGTTGAYGGNGDLNDMGWYGANSGGETHCVGQKQANAWGFHDMHGNVAEWCNDWYGYSYGGDTTDPKGPASASCRVVRGGSWFYIASCCRSAIRFGNCQPGLRSQMEGFRLCCSARPDKTDH